MDCYHSSLFFGVKVVLTLDIFPRLNKQNNIGYYCENKKYIVKNDDTASENDSHESLTGDVEDDTILQQKASGHARVSKAYILFIVYPAINLFAASVLH